MTNIYRDVILEKEDFPVKMSRLHPRASAARPGRTARNVRGLNRLHQFDKVEIVQLSLPEKSYEALDGMVAHVESIVKALGPALPHPAPVRRRHVVHLGADLRFRSLLRGPETLARSVVGIEFRVVPGQPPQTRYRDEEKKIQLAHTLNGSSLALPRIVAALLENYQTPEGIRIPEALIPYTGFDIIK